MIPQIARFFRILQQLEAGLLAGAILVIASVSIANVCCRALLNTSLTFAEEIAQIGIIGVTFLGLSYAAGQGRHIRMSVLSDQFEPHTRKKFMLVVAGGTALLMFVLAAYAVRYVVTVYTLGSVSPALQIPLFLVYTLAPIGFLLTGLQYVFSVVRNLTESN